MGEEANPIFKALSWNIKSGHYQDGDSTIAVGNKYLLEIAHVIAQCHPDAVCLQEVEINSQRSQGLHQAEEICSELNLCTGQNWQYQFMPARAMNPGFFGNAIISPHRLQMRRDLVLPRFNGRETRCCLLVSITILDYTLQVGTFHLGMKDEDNQAMMIKDWLIRIPGGTNHLLLGGDLNCDKQSRAYLSMCEYTFPLLDAGPEGCSFRCYNKADNPKIDFWFYSSDINIDKSQSQIIPVDISDHRPLLCAVISK